MRAEHEDNRFLRLMNLLEATLSPSTCVQQYICSLSKSSAKNVVQRRATSSDKIISGILGYALNQLPTVKVISLSLKIFRTRWILDIITGSAVHDAIQFGESTGDCHKKYNKCGFGGMDSEELFKMFIKSINVIK